MWSLILDLSPSHLHGEGEILLHATYACILVVC